MNKYIFGLAGFSLLFSCSVFCKDTSVVPTIDVLSKRTSDVPCQSFKGMVRQNCELTTKILLTTYMEYCATHNCKVDNIDDMIAWLEQKEAVVAQLKTSHNEENIK